MAKPSNKAQLQADLQKERASLEKALRALSDEQLSQPNIVGEWSAKDVMAHLIEWEQMVLRWLSASQRGEMPNVPAEGYTWRELPALNQHIYESYRDKTLSAIQQLFNSSFVQICAVIDAMPEETLLERGLYRWMNQNALIAYFNSATASHYRWARTEIRKGFRAKGVKL